MTQSDDGFAHGEDVPVEARALAQARADYVAALRVGDRAAATSLALGLVETGEPAERILEEIVSFGQVQVGLGWQAATWTVAMEHRASDIALAVTRAVSEAALRAADAPAEGVRGRAVVACTEGEWHLLPAQLLSETLRLRGFEVTLIGPSIAAADLAALLATETASTVAISCSMQRSLAGAGRTISALRDLGVGVVCGGGGFGSEGHWGRALGADHWAADLTSGADLLSRLLAGRRPGPRPPVGSAQARAELAALRRDSEAIVQTAASLALRNWPDLPDVSERRAASRQHLASTLMAIESTVATADPTVLASYLTWFQDVLEARHLPMAYAATALDLLIGAIPADLTLARAAAAEGLNACREPAMVP